MTFRMLVADGCWERPVNSGEGDDKETDGVDFEGINVSIGQRRLDCADQTALAGHNVV